LSSFIDLGFSAAPIEPPVVLLRWFPTLIPTPIHQITVDHDGEEHKVVGIISTFRTITTKNGSKMAFVKLEDKIKEMEAIIFPRIFEAFSSLLKQDAVVLIKGKINTKDREGNGNNEIKIMADEIKLLDEAWLKSEAVKSEDFSDQTLDDKTSKPNQKNNSGKNQINSNPNVVMKKIYIKLNVNDEEKLRMLHRIVLASPASNKEKSEIILVFGEKPDQTIIRLTQRVTLSNTLIANLEKLLGVDNLVVKE
jgi:DNA polymerase-3 subunit alpha